MALWAQPPLTVSLYGQRFSISLPPSARTVQLNMLTDETTLEKELARLESLLQPVAAAVHTESKKLRWNDWLHVKLAVALAKAIWTSEPERTLGSVALLRAFGYNAVLTVAGNQHVRLAVEIQRPIYFAAVFRLGEHSQHIFALYDIDKNDLQKTLPKDGLELLGSPTHPTRRALSFDYPLHPIFPNKLISKTLAWRYRNKKFSLTVSFNKHQLDYLASYPQLDVAWYFNQALSSAFRQQVIEPLKNILAQENLSGVQALDFLLQFCLARPYLEDQKLPRGEHCSFVEESLFDAYTDCEDRAYLLAALVQGILGYKVIGVQFPNHVAIGVHVPGASLSGKHYLFEGERYISCDPSYLGSTVGDIIEPFQHQTPERIIKIDALKFVD